MDISILILRLHTCECGIYAIVQRLCRKELKSPSKDSQQAPAG